MKGLWNLSQDEVMREIMEAEENQRRDELTREEFAWERGEQSGRVKGRQEGIEEGQKEGVEKGEQRKAREIARKMITAGADPKFVAKATGLPLKEIEKLQRK